MELLPAVTHFPQAGGRQQGVQRNPHAAARQQPRASLPPPPFPVSLSSPSLSGLSTAPCPHRFQQPLPLPAPWRGPWLCTTARFSSASLNESLMHLWVVRTTAPFEVWLIALRRGNGAWRYCARERDKERDSGCERMGARVQGRRGRVRKGRKWDEKKRRQTLTEEGSETEKGRKARGVQGDLC